MITVTDAPERRRYEAHVDGELVGFANYRRDGELEIVIHTEVDESQEGQGVGSAIAEYVMDDARERGFRVFPQCPFLAGWLERHREYDDLVEGRSAG
jgi:predicted GNAT family acetyltransferase